MPTQDDSPISQLSARAQSLINQIRPLLEQDEYCAIMTKDFNSFIMVPDEVRRRQEKGTQEAGDSLVGLILQWKFMGILLEVHGISLAKEVGPMLDTPKLTLVGPDGRPIDNRS